MADPTSEGSVVTRPAGDGGSRPIPDPTELTDRAIAKAIEALRDHIDGQLGIRDERLRGIDEATKLRLESVDRFSDELDEKVGHLAALHDVKFASIQTQFSERDTRQEREARDNKVAVDAAFAAQKEAAAKQDEANAKAIDKSERATTETIRTNLDLTRTTTDTLTKTVDEVKLALTRIESAKTGATENRTANTESRSAIIGIISVVALVIGTVVGVGAGILAAAP